MARLREDDLTTRPSDRWGRPFHLLLEEVVMSWLILFLAGLLEACWAVGLKYSDGFTRLLPSAVTVAAMLASVGLLGVAMRGLPLGTAYAVWTGIGTVGAVVAGVMLFGEQLPPLRLISVLLVLAGIVGLKLSTP
jgi:quaternary ammonium compound-resistance protein SugE